jgi:hypothetical protein
VPSKIQRSRPRSYKTPSTVVECVEFSAAGARKRRPRVAGREQCPGRTVPMRDLATPGKARPAGSISPVWVDATH